MFVKPAAGRVVRDPETYTPLPEAGREVPRSQYWMRRLRDGDVETVEENPPAKED